MQCEVAAPSIDSSLYTAVTDGKKKSDKRFRKSRIDILFRPCKLEMVRILLEMR
jgi:hypothetical protein